MSKDNAFFGVMLRTRGPFLGLVALGLAWLVAPLGCGSSDPVADVKAMHDARQYEASLEPLRDLIETRPEDAEVFYLYGVALSNRGLFTQAIWPLVRAMEDPEWYPVASLHLADVAISTTDWGIGLDVLDRFIEAEPENSKALLLRAYARAQSRQNYEGSLEDADMVLAQDPINSQALVLRGVALLGLDRIEEAAKVIEAAGEHFDTEGLGLVDAPRFCAVRAVFAKEKSELDAAEEIFEECLEKYPTHFEVVGESMKFFDSIDRPERASEIIRVAYEKAPSFRSYRSSLVYRLYTEGKTDEAEGILLEATLDSQPEAAASAFGDLAGHYFQLGKFQESVAAFEEALALLVDPRPEFLFTYADSLIVAEQYEKALELAEKMTVKPHQELIRGRISLAQGRPAQALEHFERGLLLWPENAIARYLAAIAAEKIGDFDRAIEELRYSIRADSMATDARMRLARLYAASGQPSLGLAVIRHDAENDPNRGLTETLLEIKLLGRSGLADKLSPHIMEVLAPPQAWARAVAAMAEGVRQAEGSEAAADVVLKAVNIDLTSPLYVAALSSLVADLVPLGRGPEALSRTESALSLHPEASELHAVRGQALSLTGADAKEIRAAWTRALELDPGSAMALRGLAGLDAAEGKADSALALYRRAALAEPWESEALARAADVLISEGRFGEAKLELERLLERDPYDGGAALRLAELLVEEEGGAEQLRARVLFHKAKRFGGGPEAGRLLSTPTEPKTEPKTEPDAVQAL